MGPKSYAVLVNELLDGRLEERLRAWRAERKSDREIAELLTAELRERAASQGRVFEERITQRSVWRWRNEVYGIE